MIGFRQAATLTMLLLLGAASWWGPNVAEGEDDVTRDTAIQWAVYRNPDLGYELDYPSEYVVVDRANVDEREPLVPQAYQIVVATNRQDRLAAPGTALFFSPTNGMFEISGEECERGKHDTGRLSVNGKEYNPDRDLKAAVEYRLDLMKMFSGITVEGQSHEIWHRAVPLQPGEAHEFVTKRVEARKNTTFFEYELLIPVRDKFVVAGFTYKDETETVELQKRALLSIRLR